MLPPPPSAAGCDVGVLLSHCCMAPRTRVELCAWPQRCSVPMVSPGTARQLLLLLGLGLSRLGSVACSRCYLGTDCHVGTTSSTAAGSNSTSCTALGVCNVLGAGGSGTPSARCRAAAASNPGPGLGDRGGRCKMSSEATPAQKTQREPNQKAHRPQTHPEAPP